jgi:predicted permease
MTSVTGDLKYAARTLARAPGFTAVVVATLALGIGANTAIFSVVRGVLLESLPYRDAQRLVRIGHARAEGGRPGQSFSPQDFDDLARERPGLSRVASYQFSPGLSGMNLLGKGEPARVSACYLIDFLPRLLPEASFSAPIDAHMSSRVLLFGCGAALASLAVFGLFPAWQASATAPAGAVKQQASSAGASRAGARSVLMVAQVALSLVLAVSAGLLIRSLVNASNANPGFDAHQKMLVLELVPGMGARDAGGQRAFLENARRRIEALPGVAGTAAGMRIPFGLSGSGATMKAFFPGSPGGGVEGIQIHYDPVSDRFFEMVGTRLLSGRAIDARDLQAHARVMLVNQTMARRFWKGRDPIGQRVRLGKPDGDFYEVIGVSENSVNAELGEDPMPYLYTPMGADDYGELTLVVKTASDASRLADPVRRVLREADRDVPIIYLATLSEHMRLATSDQRMTTGLVVSLGVLGLFLVAVGLYGLTSFLVGRRTREIGIRLALGARPGSIFRLVIGRAQVLAGLGVLAGSFAAAAVTRVLRSFLFGVVPGDPAAYAIGVAARRGRLHGRVSSRAPRHARGSDHGAPMGVTLSGARQGEP